MTLVADAKKRELYRIGKVVDAQIVSEERYTASTRRKRYRYQLHADGIRFTLRNRPGTQRLRTGTTVAIIYDPENISNFRLYMGEPQPNAGLLISGIGLLAVGSIGVVLPIRFKLC